MKFTLNIFVCCLDISKKLTTIGFGKHSDFIKDLDFFSFHLIKILKFIQHFNFWFKFGKGQTGLLTFSQKTT